MNIIRTKRKFNYKGIEIRIVEVEEPYMNSEETVKVTRVIAPNNGIIPLQLVRNQTLKSIIDTTIRVLDGFSGRGADVVDELTKEI